MAEATVWTFLYGSFMNLDVLKQGGFVPERYEAAWLTEELVRPVKVEMLKGAAKVERQKVTVPGRFQRRRMRFPPKVPPSR